MEEIEITVYGRVQGINLRWMTKQFCDKIGLNGYVINKEDGGVFIAAQGKKESLIELLRWFQSNPGLSKIEKAEYRWKKPSISYKEFLILRRKGS